MRSAFERRGATMHSLLTGIDGVTALEPQGVFYSFPNLSSYLGRTFRRRTPTTTDPLCEVLPYEAKQASVPGEGVDAHGDARRSYDLVDVDLGERGRRQTHLPSEPQCRRGGP